LLTKSDSMTQEFTTLVLRFTDGTADEIRKASAGAAGAPEKHVQDAAADLAKNYRKDMSDNIELCILQDDSAAERARTFWRRSTWATC